MLKNSCLPILLGLVLVSTESCSVGSSNSSFHHSSPGAIKILDSDQDVRQSIGPQLISEPNVESNGNADPAIERCLLAGIVTAKQLGFHYNASESQKGVLVVFATFKKQPVTLVMRFYRGNMNNLYIGSLAQASGNVAADGGIQAIEKLYYQTLRKETERQGLTIYSAKVGLQSKGNNVENSLRSPWPDPPGTGLDLVCGTPARCDENKVRSYPPPVHPDRVPLK